MVYPNNGWLDRVIQSAIAAFVVAVFAVGCASSPPTTSDSASEAAMVQTLGEVSVSRVGDDSVIWLEGLADPIYSVSTPEDSNLIVVDLVGVDQLEAADESGGVPDEGRQIATYDGVVDLITLATFDEDGDTPLTRLEIVMANEGRAEVLSTGDGLEIRVIPGAGEADMAASPEDALEAAPWGAGDAEGSETSSSDFDSPEGSEASKSDFDASEVVMSMTPPPAASQLTGVSAETTD